MPFERRLQVTQPEPKFWNISVAGDELLIRSGRLGTPGTQSRIPCKSPEAAQKTAESLIAQRLKDGFRDEASVPKTGVAIDAAIEQEMLKDDPERWLVFADALMETSDAVRGEFVARQVRAAKRVRGAIGQAKAFLQANYDELVGELGAYHKQLFLDWRFGFARTVRVWSSPYSEPIGVVLPYVFLSPAARFLQRLELGSPGTEGKYDATLRTLAKLEWPAHLDTLFLGNFDVQLAKEMDSAWPRIDSLAALQPVASRLRVIELRAIVNTLGKSLSFPKLERLVLTPSRIDARLVSDLQSWDVPSLRALSLTEEAPPSASRDALASAFRQLLLHPGLKELALHQVTGAAELLASVGEPLKRLDALDLRGSVNTDDLEALLGLAPLLSQARLDVGLGQTLLAKLGPAYPRLVTEHPVEKPSGPKPVKRRRPRYTPIAE